MLGWTFNPKTYFDSAADVRWVSLCAEGAKMYKSLLTEQWHFTATTRCSCRWLGSCCAPAGRRGSPPWATFAQHLRAQDGQLAKTARFPGEAAVPIPTPKKLARAAGHFGWQNRRTCARPAARARHLTGSRAKRRSKWTRIARLTATAQRRHGPGRCDQCTTSARARCAGAGDVLQRITNNNNAQLWLRLLKQSGLMMSVKQPWATAILECGKRYEPQAAVPAGPGCAYSRPTARWMLIIASEQAAPRFRADLERVQPASSTPINPTSRSAFRCARLDIDGRLQGRGDSRSAASSAWRASVAAYATRRAPIRPTRRGSGRRASCCHLHSAGRLTR